MSKIPRSFVTPSSKLPVVNATPLQEPPKFICPQKTPVVRSAPLQDITSSKNKAPAELIVNIKKPETLKRHAGTLDMHPPKKQLKLNTKASNTAKIPSYDYKARFNDLNEKFKILKNEHTDLKEKYEENSEELENSKTSFETQLNKYAEASDKLDSVSVEYENLKKQYEELISKYDLENLENENLKKKLNEVNDELQNLKKILKEVTTRLAETEFKLSNKSVEYDLLKTSLEKEIEKCLLLSTQCKENQDKIMSLSNEISFLTTRQKLMDQKNEENNITIATLLQEKEKASSEIQQLTGSLAQMTRKLEDKAAECDNFTIAYNTEVQKSKQLDLIVCNNTEKINNYQIDVTNLTRTKEYLEMKTELDSLEIVGLKQKNIDLQKVIEAMYEKEKRLRNEIQDLKGHIRVFCRIRPTISGESSRQLYSIDVLDSCTMEIDKAASSNAPGGTKIQKHNFSFDGIFSPHTPQSEVFSEVSSLVQSALDGYNVCIFAYGQTGSGKTYTMEGGKDDLSMGIVPRAFELIFSSLPELKKIGWEFKIYASFLEIYNENIYDLLDSSKDQEDHAIKMVDSKGSDVYVSNLKEECVETASQLMKLLTISQRNRLTAATLCNERSSRSHSVSKIRICAYHNKRKEKYTSNLNLVDLAGSESGKTSQRMDETKCINKSLLELSKVIIALQSKQSHIPYRNSKLTYLLMPSLGGNSKTLMLVNIAQLDECYQETLNSLRFAAKVNNCQKGVTKKNITTL